jgi:hypothetical protein
MASAIITKPTVQEPREKTLSIKTEMANATIVGQLVRVKDQGTVVPKDKVAEPVAEKAREKATAADKGIRTEMVVQARAVHQRPNPTSK